MFLIIEPHAEMTDLRQKRTMVETTQTVRPNRPILAKAEKNQVKNLYWFTYSINRLKPLFIFSLCFGNAVFWKVRQYCSTHFEPIQM